MPVFDVSHFDSKYRVPLKGGLYSIHSSGEQGNEIILNGQGVNKTIRFNEANIAWFDRDKRFALIVERYGDRIFWLDSVEARLVCCAFMINRTENDFECYMEAFEHNDGPIVLYEFGVISFDPTGRVLWNLKSKDRLIGQPAIVNGEILRIVVHEQIFRIDLQHGQFMNTAP